MLAFIKTKFFDAQSYFKRAAIYERILKFFFLKFMELKTRNKRNKETSEKNRD